MKNKNWKKEVARDFLSLGSIVFFVLVVARALIKPYRPFVDQMIVAGLTLFILSFILKDSDNYIARSLILVVFTVLFYEDNVFTLFAILALVGVIISSYYSGTSKSQIFNGLINGIASSGVGYYLAGFVVGLI